MASGAEDIARALYAQGEGCVAIAKRLTELGLPTPSGKPWHHEQVRRMVSAPKAQQPRQVAPPPEPPRPPREPEPLPPDASPLERRLLLRRAELDQMADDAAGAGSWSAAVVAKRAAVALEAEIDAARPKAGAEDPTAGMTDEEITARICAEVAGWDEDRCDAVEEAIAARRGIRLRVVGE